LASDAGLDDKTHAAIIKTALIDKAVLPLIGAGQKGVPQIAILCCVAQKLFEGVTVSMGELTIGVRIAIFFVTFVPSFTSSAAKFMYPGWKMISS
jgi:hypothetical protein